MDEAKHFLIVIKEPCDFYRKEISFWDHMSKGKDKAAVLNCCPHNIFSHEQLFWSDRLKISKSQGQ